MSGQIKHASAVLFVLFLCSPVAAVDFAAPKLICILGTADAVVRTGDDHNAANDFIVTIDEVIRGDNLHESDRIRIAGEGKWYADTPLASFTGYGAAVLFLSHESDSDTWRLVGPLGAGRMLLHDRYVYLGGFATNIPREIYHVGEPPLQRLKLDTLLLADRDLASCLAWRKDKANARARLICPVSKLQSLEERSELHRLLVEEVVADLGSGLVCSR